MKNTFLVISMAVIATFNITAQDILPGLRNYGESKINAEARVEIVYPNTIAAMEKLEQLRQGGRSDLITVEWVVGPSPFPISSAVLEAQKHHSRASLASSVNAYVRGEAALLVLNEDLFAKLVTEVSATVVFSEMLRNNRVELQLSYRFRNPDGSTGYLEVFYLGIDKESVNNEIRNTANRISENGSGGGGKNADPVPVREVANNTESFFEPFVLATDSDLVKSVQAVLDSNERINRYREENRQLFGFGSNCE